MHRVIIESPYAGDTERNLRYARAAMKDSLDRGEAPFLSHLLDDSLDHERHMGIEAGLSWMEKADAVLVYDDLGISSGMKYGITRAAELGMKILFCSIPNWESEP